MKKINLAIRKWLGVKDRKHYFALEISRIRKPRTLKREKEFQAELLKLAKKYEDVPMFFIQNIKFRWRKEKENTILYLPDEKSLHGIVYSSHFFGRSDI